MSQRKLEPWEEHGWVRGTQLPGGNQGHTFLARKKDDDSNSFNYVLKVLKRRDDEVRRARFHIEAASLRALDVPGVARLADSNADKFLESDIDLFVVTERIIGSDLENRRGTPTDILTACRILIPILAAIQRCHEVPVVHRDIKPCHVILRDSKLDDPVLIDFGLAFNEEIFLPKTATALEQGVGNRFILLPEQLYGLNKRDPQSDVTQCVGLLFYLLTGKDPGIIFDTNGKKPHERESLELHGVASDVQKRQLRHIFDVGFEWNIEKRWPTAESLSRKLEHLIEGKENPSGQDFVAGLDELAKRIADDPEHGSRKQAKVLFQQLVKHGEQCAQHAAQKFSDSLSVGGSAHQEKAGTSYSIIWHLLPTFGDPQTYRLSVHARRDIDRLRMNGGLIRNPPGAFGGFASTVENAANTVFEVEAEVPIASPQADDEIRRFLSQLWVKGIENVFYPNGE